MLALYSSAMDRKPSKGGPCLSIKPCDGETETELEECHAAKTAALCNITEKNDIHPSIEYDVMKLIQSHLSYLSILIVERLHLCS